MTSEKDLELEPAGINVLIKTGKREHLEQFANGLLYCNSLAFLSDQKHRNEAWFDADEGLAAQFLPEKIGSIRYQLEKDRPPVEIRPTELGGPVRVATGHDFRVFCTYAVHSGVWSEPFTRDRLWDYLNYIWIKPRIHAYGEHAALVIDVGQFVTRVRDAVESRGFGGSAGLVKYVDLKRHHGTFPERLHGRIKHIKFKDEREHRFILIPHDNLDVMEPVRLELGSLRGIVKIATWDEIRKTLKFRLPNNGRYLPLVRPRRLPRRLKKELKKG